jgi:phosphoglycolate phosphatase
MNQLNEFIKSFDLIIFDLDGTLIDSHNQIEKAMNQARIELGYGKSPSGQIFRNLGMPVEHLFLDLSLTADNADILILEFRTNLTQLIQQGNECFPGVIRMLTQIKLMGKKVSVATGKSSSMATQVIQHSPLASLIDIIQGTDGFPAKPNPEVITRCLRRFPDLKAVMIGDRVEDILAANSAGIDSVGIAQSAHSVDDLLGAGAIHAYESFDAI